MCSHGINFHKTEIYLKYISEITHSGKPTPVNALGLRLFLNVGVAQLIQHILTLTLNNLFHFRIKQPLWCDKTIQ